MPVAELKSGRPLYYESGESDGDAVLYLDGTGSDLRDGSAATLMAFLGEDFTGERGFRMIFVDHRGMGRSSHIAEDAGTQWTMADFADDVAELLEILQVDGAHVIGWSFGGMVAQHVAARHPCKVLSLVLACTSSGGAGGSSYPLHELIGMDMESKSRIMIPILDTRDKVTDESLQRSVAFQKAHQERLDRTLGAVDGEKRQLQARACHDAWDALKAFQCPVLFISGDFDGIAPPALSASMAQQIAGAIQKTFLGGHLMLKFGPVKQEAWQCIMEFLLDQTIS